MNSIEIRNLQKNYKNFSLTIDNLEIPEGYITGFIGPNGSGKTTTIKSLLGMIKPDSGEIKILNSHINKDTKTKENIAYVGDESGFLEESKLVNLHKIISKFYSNWDEELYKKYLPTTPTATKTKINDSSVDFTGLEVGAYLITASGNTTSYTVMGAATYDYGENNNLIK